MVGLCGAPIYEMVLAETKLPVASNLQFLCAWKSSNTHGFPKRQTNMYINHSSGMKMFAQVNLCQPC